MWRVKEKLLKYYKIYEQLYEDPLIPAVEIEKNTGIADSTISTYFREMYELSILKGPLIFLKPARNYHEYAHLLTFENPLLAYRGFKDFPRISRSLASGGWNLLLISDGLINFSILKGFKHCLLKGVKGVTYLSKVTSLDWDESMEKMCSMMHPPKKKSSLYREIPGISWEPKEWTMYDRLRRNVRTRKLYILKQCQIRYMHYRSWILRLPQFSSIQAAFYPYGTENYLFLDFLFKSKYQKQLADILGLLPSTSMFFSVGNYLFARLSVRDIFERRSLFSFIFELQEKGFFSHFYQASVISTSELGLEIR